MSRRLLGLALLALLPACGGALEEPRPPLADSTLVTVLADLELLQARAELGLPVTPELRDSVLAAHGLDSTRYHEVMSWYAEHPEALAALYGAVVDRLNQDRLPLMER